MQVKDFEVKSKSKVVGMAKVEIFETLGEAIDHLGEAKCLELINTQNKTTTMNVVRQEKAGRPTKKSLWNMAFAETTPEELQQVAGDPAAIDRLITAKVNAIKARMGLDEEDDGSDNDE
jgi:hypothetical protein